MAQFFLQMTNVIPTELGTEKVSKLLKQYAVPAIIAMTASSLYNSVDSIFIGQGVGPYAIAGLALTFPLMNLCTAIGTLVGIGASTLISVLLGQKNYEVAEKVFGNSLTLNVICGFIVGVLGIAFLKPILYFFGGSDMTIKYAQDYMVIILAGNIITHLYFGMNNILRVMGLPKKAMGATIFTVLLNTVLDPIFIFWFDWGIRGAAIATVLSQFVAMLYLFWLCSDQSRLIRLKRGIYKIKKHIVKQIFAIGLSPFLINACACLVVIVFNKQLNKYDGDLAIAAYGIVNRLAFIFIMIVFGFNQGMQPIAGFNYGAKNVERVRQVLNLTIKCGVVVMTIGFLVAELFPESLARIFTNDPKLIENSTLGIRLGFLIFPLIGFQIVVTNFFQCIGQVNKSIFLSLSRQALCLIPMLYVFPLLWGIRGVWCALPASDFCSVVMAAILFSHQRKTFKRELANSSQSDS